MVKTFPARMKLMQSSLSLRVSVELASTGTSGQGTLCGPQQHHSLFPGAPSYRGLAGLLASLALHFLTHSFPEHRGHGTSALN